MVSNSAVRQLHLDLYAPSTAADWIESAEQSDQYKTKLGCRRVTARCVMVYENVLTVKSLQDQDQDRDSSD